jgi:hypothetical protein
MRLMNNWLQFFAEGTAETNGATGENAAASGQEMNQDTGNRTQDTGHRCCCLHLGGRAGKGRHEAAYFGDCIPESRRYLETV